MIFMLTTVRRFLNRSQSWYRYISRSLTYWVLGGFLIPMLIGAMTQHRAPRTGQVNVTHRATAVLARRFCPEVRLHSQEK